MALSDLTFVPLTPARWADFENLFGERGACGGCWCMWWHRTRAEFEESKGEANRRAMCARVSGGEEPGILAYAGRTPVGWCAIGPRDGYPAIVASRALRQVPGDDVWSVTCFFVHRTYRGTGISVVLLRAAIEHARKHGARVIEGYPSPGPACAPPSIAPASGRSFGGRRRAPPCACSWNGRGGGGPRRRARMRATRPETIEEDEACRPATRTLAGRGI